jgi:rod shape-determining protein MreD
VTGPRWGLSLLVILTVVLIQVAVLDTLGLDPIRIDLPLLLVLGFGFTARPADAALLGFVTGFLLDLHQLSPLGLEALVFAVAAWGLAVGKVRVLQPGPFFLTIQGGLAAVSASALLWVAGSVFEQDPVPAGWSLVVAAAGLAVSGAVGVHPASALARWLQQSHPLASGTAVDRSRAA